MMRKLNSVGIGAVVGLASLIGNNGCRTVPVYNEKREIIEYKKEFDTKKAIGVITYAGGTLISLGGALVGIPTAPILGVASRKIEEDLMNENREITSVVIAAPPQENVFLSEERRNQVYPCSIRVSSAIGIEPLHIGYSADVKKEISRDSNYIWTLDGEPVGNRINGQRTLNEVGEHTLGLLVLEPNGKEHRAYRLVRVLPRLQNKK